jgi:hypothetical protein
MRRDLIKDQTPHRAPFSMFKKYSNCTRLPHAPTPKKKARPVPDAPFQTLTLNPILPDLQRGQTDHV